MSKSMGLGLIVGCLWLVGGARAQERPAEEVQIRMFRMRLCDPDEVALVLQQLLGGEAAGPAVVAYTPGPEGMPKPALVNAKVAVDARSGSVIVRGRAEHIELASELVSILEQPPGKALPKTKRLQALELKHAAANELETLTKQLGLRAMGLPDLKLVIAAGGEAELAAWSKLVRDLDVPERKIDGKNMRRLGVLSPPGTVPIPALPVVSPPPGMVPGAKQPNRISSGGQ